MKTYPLRRVQFGPDGTPTAASLRDIANQAAVDEKADPSTVRMNYFKTKAAGTVASLARAPARAH